MVLRHLPKVTGSERNLEIYMSQCKGHDTYSTHDEFDVFQEHESKLQSTYLLTLQGYLRDRMYNQTYREFIKWLTRLSKRIYVNDVFVKVFDPYGNASVVTNENFRFSDMHEWGSYTRDGVPNWTEFMFWDTDGCDRYPLTLLAREGDEDAIEELARRRAWEESQYDKFRQVES